MDYSAEVLRRFDSPAAAGEIDGAEASAGLVAAEAEDRSLNVWVRFQVQLRDVDGEAVIGEARFSAFGCPHTIAAADCAAERLRGQPAAALRQIDVAGIGRELEVPIEKLGKLLRIEDALAACADRIGAPAPDGEE